MTSTANTRLLAPMTHRDYRLYFFAFALVLVACSAAKPQVVELDPIEIKADDQKRAYIRDFDLLTSEASQRRESGDHAEAVRLYLIVIKEFPKAPHLSAIHYNCGLSFMQLKDHAKAAEQFALARKLAHGTRDARDALFLQAEAEEAAEHWQAAADIYKAALEDPAMQEEIGGVLGLLDELEATARLGLMLRKLGDPQRADVALRRVERIYSDHRDVNVVAESVWVARALFERGDIYRELFATIRFKLPVERMERDLEDKANLFLKSENAFYHCVRLHHRNWSLAAGFQIGALYATLISDIDNAEVPPEVTERMADVYRDELWKHTEKLAKRATVIYKKNIELAISLGEKDGDWARKSQEGLAQMEKMIEVSNERKARVAKQEAAEATAASLPQDPTPVAQKPQSGKKHPPKKAALGVK